MGNPGVARQGVRECVSLEVIYERLLVTAEIALLPYKGVPCPEPQELVNCVFSRYLSSPTGLNYDPRKSRLDTFLAGVLKKILLEEIRKAHVASLSMDDADLTDSLQTILPKIDPSESYINTKFIEEIARFLESDPELSELFLAIVDTVETSDDNRNINQKLAQRLRRTVSQVVNDRKRLRRRLEGLL